jgi:hypothetical protein
MAELAVQPSVVEPLDVGKRLELDVLGVAPRPSATDQLGLEDPVEALGEGIGPRSQLRLIPMDHGELFG